MSEEALFYSDAMGVRVTDNGVTLDGISYPLANAAFVAARVERPSRVGPLLCIAIGVSFLAERIAQASPGGAILPCVVVVVGMIWFRECRPVHCLDLSNAFGESAPVLRGAEDRITSIANAINNAIAHRTGTLSAQPALSICDGEAPSLTSYH